MIIDRASIFSDPEILATLKERFVNVAIDQWYHRRQQDAEGNFYRKIAGQARGTDFNSTTQGLYFATANGDLLGWTNNRSPERMKDLLRRSLEKHTASETSAVTNGVPDRNFVYAPPEGGLVLSVTGKVLEGYAKPASEEERWFQESLGRDVLWLRREEHAALAKGEVPASLRSRMARFTLMDFTRGEPAFWAPEEVRVMELAAKDGVLSGKVHVESRDGKRGFQADLRGVLEAKDGKVTRFDLVARGSAWGAGGVTQTAAPKGRFTLAVAYRLASGSDEADKVMPQGAKAWFPEYIK